MKKMLILAVALAVFASITVPGTKSERGNNLADVYERHDILHDVLSVVEIGGIKLHDTVKGVMGEEPSMHDTVKRHDVLASAADEMNVPDVNGNGC